MPVPFGGWTKSCPLTNPNVCNTPAEGFPGSPTVAIRIVTTPRFVTGRTDEVDPVVVDDVVDEESELEEERLHPVAPTESAASKATHVVKWHRGGLKLTRRYGHASSPYITPSG